MGFLLVTLVLQLVLPILSAQTDSFFVQAKVQELKTTTINQQQPPIFFASPTPTIRVPSKTPTPSIFNTPKRIQQTDILRSAINSFRQDHGLSLLVSENELCTIAKNRLDSLIAKKSLDNHDGFSNYTDRLSIQFRSWGEILHFSSPAWNATRIVDNGWATSSKGHREAMLAPAYTHGCGAMKSGFAVFIFGQKK